MKTFTAAELAEVIDQHHAWLLDNSQGARANLRYASLSSADLRYANLRYADLSSADLSSADLRYANLSYANLRYASLSSADLRYANLSSADLSSADLSSADLRYANLSYANLRYASLSSVASLKGAVGNMGQLKSIQCDYWPVAYTHQSIQIGCQRHSIDEWWAFTDKEIASMDNRALSWWQAWKPILQTIIATSPAIAPEYAA